MNPSLAAIAVGSNVGDRQRFLNDALALVDRIPGVAVVATSRVHESAGWGRDGLKPFLNAVLTAEVRGLTPLQLLRSLQRIEDQLGRQRTLKWGPRTLDLDLLAFDDMEIDTPDLILPHPWISRRPFVYAPFREIPHLRPEWGLLATAHPEGVALENDTQPIPNQSFPWGQFHSAEAESLVETESEEDTESLGRSIGGVLCGGEIVALDAPMGTGKSVLARGIARGLGIAGPIQSPSYTLCRRYETGRLVLEHWDFYRLGSLDDLESTGYFDPLGSDTVRVIEWASSFPEAIERPFMTIELNPLGVELRRLLLCGPVDGALPYSIRALLEKHRAGKVTH